MDLVKSSVLANLILIIIFLFLILIKFFFYIKNQVKSNILKKKEFPTLIIGFFKTKYIILLIISLSIILSILRAFFVDPQIIVSDGYDYYANQIKLLLSDWSFDIDNELVSPGTIGVDFSHKLRILYSLIIAIINVIFPKINIISVGRIISVFSFLFSILFLSKILKNFKFTEDKKNILKISMIFILNPTIMTNLIRFETDMLFLAFSLLILYLYLKIIKKKANIVDIFLFLVSSVLLFFVREVGAILLIALIFHFIIIQNTKIKISIFVVSFITIIILSYFGIFQTFLFYIILSATLRDIAYDIVYNLSLKLYVEQFIINITNSYTIVKTIESIVYSFLPSAIFGSLGFINLYKKTKRKRKLFFNPFGLYFMFFVGIYILIKIGRGLDRFWIPILIIPCILLPYSYSIKNIGKNIKQNFQRFRNKIVHRITKKPINEAIEVNNTISVNQNYFISNDIVIFTIIVQLLIFVLRFCLSLFNISFAG